MSVKDREKFRWSLEEYLQFPYGAERDKSHHVEEKMKEWGELLFNQVFAECDFDPYPHTFYQEAVREGLGTCELIKLPRTQHS